MAPTRRVLGPALAVLGVLTLCAGIGCTAPSSGRTDVRRDGWFRATLAVPTGEEVPFFLRLPQDCAVGTATIVNGEERIDTPCDLRQDVVTLEFPVYGTLIEAAVQPDGRLVGSWDRVLPAGRHPAMAFAAEPVEDPDPERRFSGARVPAAASPARPDLTGTWRFDIDSLGVARGTLGQTASGIVRGTLEAPRKYGDLRYLAGNLVGRKIFLSTFDGQEAVLVTGQVVGSDALQGEIILSGTRGWFAARRDDDFALEDPLDRVRVMSPDGRLDLEPLEREPYLGHPVIVEIFGTWCPNCNDLAPALTELYRAHHDDGLEILGLAYEMSVDPVYTEGRIEAFRSTHEADWEILVADVTADELPLNPPGALSVIDGVPVTIFVNRDRTVQGIYAGFSGPATGDTHRQAIAELRRLTTEILHRD